MSGDVGYLIVTGAVWAVLVFLLMLAIIGLLRSIAETRRHHRRHRLVCLERAMRDAPRAAPAPHHLRPGAPAVPEMGVGEAGPPSTSASRTARAVEGSGARTAPESAGGAGLEPVEEDGEGEDSLPPASR